MPSIKKLIESYQLIRGRIDEAKNKLAELRKEERELNEELVTYLVTSGEDGIRIDSNTVINLKDVDKKIVVSMPKYKEKIKSLLVEKGMYVAGLEDEIIQAKVDGRVTEQKLKVNRKK